MTTALLASLVHAIYVIISVLGALVVIWGVLEAMIGFLRTKVWTRIPDQIRESEAIRQRLGAHLLLGLEIFIAADIISSVVSPSWDKVGILAAIVAIRTVLSYFLRRELRQTNDIKANVDGGVKL
ncbi:MAG: DUF1622 domain-containing protein [Betaproteobacteria bacterium]|nr:DUF1622 domain-containing protein [Betaproteobacteria bacterium]